VDRQPPVDVLAAVRLALGPLLARQRLAYWGSALIRRVQYSLIVDLGLGVAGFLADGWPSSSDWEWNDFDPCLVEARRWPCDALLGFGTGEEGPDRDHVGFTLGCGGLEACHRDVNVAVACAVFGRRDPGLLDRSDELVENCEPFVEVGMVVRTARTGPTMTA
jgi:hypothetical protein